MPSVKRLKRFRVNKTRRSTCLDVISPENNMILAEIDISSVKYNMDYLSSKSGTEIMPVLKANAYGHGLVEMARIVRKLGSRHIGVATLGEAIALRMSGDKGRILAWMYDINGQELIDAFHLDIDIAIYDDSIIPQFVKKIPSGICVKITLFVDTGINRSGIPYNNAFDAFLEVQKYPAMEIVGLMSHLSCSTEKTNPSVKVQLNKFRQLRRRLNDIGINPPLVHIANTDACINYDVSDFTLARAGSGIFGLTTAASNNHFRPVMTLSAPIIQIKQINKGSEVGYCGKYKASVSKKICIIPIGYADIPSLNSSLKLRVFINGQKRRVLGILNMDQLVVESKKNDRLGDRCILFGNGINCPLTIHDLSATSGQSIFEIVSHLGSRINYVYK